MKRYNPKEIEPKWQKKWEEDGIYHATEDPKKPKRYVLEYFPYPSGAAMHVGHVRNYTIGDAISRWRRMMGDNVLHPMGWDAFGLPAENYAIKTGISPQQAIKENTTKFKQQLTQMGFGYDWSREIDSSNPAYYKWTQWLFLLLFKRDLAYQQESLQWWCPFDKTVLANEQVEAGRCWRCGNEVEKKALKQWFFKITDYADRLAADLETLNWTESIKSMQRNWIGKSEGAEVDFKIEGYEEEIKVFTTAHDTIFGVTFMVLAPEHPLLEKIVPASHKEQVSNYLAKTRAKTDIERQETEREKTGVFTGAYAINPVNKQKVPIWTADYVLLGYGTGAVMAVPGEDARDYAFAKKFDLPIVYTTLQQEFVDYQTQLKQNRKKYTLANSDKFNGLDFETGRQKILDELVKLKVGKATINYKIRDWLISRQRYWGAPIPIIHCTKCGVVPVPEEDLPVKLPPMKSYEPNGDGRSPLARVPDFVNTTCPKCGGKAERETDTMDGFACSSWYFLRFADPYNTKEAFDAKKADFWLPVDDYIGGAEHAVMHLLYARFWTKVMHDAKLINFDEPFSTLRNHGMILAPDGRKMSKSWGNVIAPDDLIAQGYGADTVRIMELFIGPWNQSANWSVEGMGGSFRFLQRVWTLVQEYLGTEDGTQKTEGGQSGELLQKTHQTIARVSKDLEDLGFNTGVAALMEYVNELYKLKAKHGFTQQRDWQFALTTLAQLLAPFAPHLSEELWQELGQKGSVHTSSWPVYDPKYLVTDTVTIVVQVNGKVRANLSMSVGSSEEAVTKAAKVDDKVKLYLDKTIRKTIYVPDKLVNFVV